MSFAARALLNLGSVATNVQSLGAMLLGGTSIVSVDYAVAMTVNSDGTITWLNQMNAVQTTPTGVAWYAPTTGGVGSGYRVRFTLQSGTAWGGGLTSGTLYSLSSPRQVFWTLPAEGTVTAQVLVEITSSTDTVVLGSGVLTVDMLDEY